MHMNLKALPEEWICNNHMQKLLFTLSPPKPRETSGWLRVWTLQRTEQPAGSQSHSANDSSLMNRQGNLILLGPPADTNRTATKPIKADGGSACLDILCSREKTTTAHTSAAAQWTLGSRCDKNEDCRHLRGSRSHKTAKVKSVSSDVPQWWTDKHREEPLHGRVNYTYWKSIAIFQ